jgi:hypothetical protein
MVSREDCVGRRLKDVGSERKLIFFVFRIDSIEVREVLMRVQASKKFNAIYKKLSDASTPSTGNYSSLPPLTQPNSQFRYPKLASIKSMKTKTTVDQISEDQTSKTAKLGSHD